MCVCETEREGQAEIDHQTKTNIVVDAEDVYLNVEVHACVDACVCVCSFACVCQKDRETNNERQQDILRKDKEKQKV